MINFIVNIKSGKGKGLKNLKNIISYCSKRNIKNTIHITSCKGHATEITKGLCELGAQTIIAVGGDGTFHEVLNGMDFNNTALGFIPSGRGNDYAKCAGLNLDPIKAFEDILKNEMIYKDYIQVGDKRCLNVVGTGIDVDVLTRTYGKNGKITYLQSLFYCLRHFKPYEIEVIHNGVSSLYNCAMVGICNGSTIGGGIRICPAAKPDDNILNAVIISMPESGKVFSALPSLLKGKHLQKEFTKHFECSEIIIKNLNQKPIQIDGEIYPESVMNCKIIKNGLKTFRTTF